MSMNFMQNKFSSARRKNELWRVLQRLMVLDVRWTSVKHGP